MGDQNPIDVNFRKRHRKLNPFRLFRGFVCLIVLFSTAFMMLVYCGFITGVMLRLFSIRYSRKAISFFLGAWLALWPFLFEKINKTKVVFSGDNIYSLERILLIANHRTEVDWMYLWDFALRKGCLGYIKYILKSSLMRLPVFGWGFHLLEFIPVQRKWEVDESVVHQMLSTFKDPRDPLWLVIFPEGTDYTEQKCIRSQKYAADSGLPVLKNVLLPKTKGFCACLQELRGSLDAVYDVTLAYKERCPSLLDNVFGLDPSEVHIHVHRHPIENIPKHEDEVCRWLMNTFQLKDQMLCNFYSRGQFPNQGTEDDLSTFKCLVNFLLVVVFTSTCIFYTLSNTWFRLYVSLTCAYLAPATYFNFKPRPTLEIFRGAFNCHDSK